MLMRAIRLWLVLAILAILAGFAARYADRAFGDPGNDAEKAYEELLAAEHWQQVRTAAETLGALGETGLPFLVKGTKQESATVRRQCYSTLSKMFPKHPKSIKAVIAGLEDSDSHVSYSCAFNLGKNRVAEAKDALVAFRKDTQHSKAARFAAAKSLAELGHKEIIVVLFVGLGSDIYSSRYLSNIGVKALCGKDLTDFGYEGPREGGIVSHGMFHGKGLPIEKAKKRLDRCRAVVEFAEWLKKEKPDLFKELDNLMFLAYPGV